MDTDDEGTGRSPEGLDPRSLSPSALEREVERLGGRAEHAARLLAHVVKLGRVTPDGLARMPRRVVDAVPWPLPRLRLVEKRVSSVYPFHKLAYETGDGRILESVLIPVTQGRFSVCVSSQVGCRRGCLVCATARMPRPRDLSAWEIVDQIVQGVAVAPGPVRAVVFLGMGEPLDNYDEVMAAAEIASHPAVGAAQAKAITIGTVGVVPAMRRFAGERRRFRLAVSLGSADPERRAHLMPVSRLWPLPELADAVRAVHAAQGERQMIAMTMLGGYNTGEDEVRALARWLTDVPYRLSLIDVAPGPHHPFRPPTKAESDVFIEAFRRVGMPFTRRLSGGADIDAACGMLAGKLALSG
ncbi:MAG: radical SAM protein [Deltaproteobacteria bacterium]|nr:radical SAM protein [Deltaproteobacteria bacterium]